MGITMNDPSRETSLISFADRKLHVRFRDDQLAPEIDHDLLLHLVRNELTVEASRLVFRLIHSFECWRNAHADVVVSEFQRGQQASS